MTLPYANSATKGVDELASCDCCNARVPKDQIWHGYVTGIETFACPACCGQDEELEECVYCDATSDGIYKGDRFNEPRCGSCHFEWNPKK